MMTWFPLTGKHEVQRGITRLERVVRSASARLIGESCIGSGCSRKDFTEIVRCWSPIRFKNIETDGLSDGVLCVIAIF